MIVRFRTEGGAPDPRLPARVEIGWPLRRGDALLVNGVRFEVREVVISIERTEGTVTVNDTTWVRDAIAADVAVLEVRDA